MSSPAEVRAEENQLTSKSLQTAKDIVAGASGGIAQVLIGKCHTVMDVRWRGTAKDLWRWLREVVFKSYKTIGS